MLAFALCSCFTASLSDPSSSGHPPPSRVLLQPLNGSTAPRQGAMTAVLGGEGDVVDMTIDGVDWMSHTFRFGTLALICPRILLPPQ